jgi:hypothetical protein
MLDVRIFVKVVDSIRVEERCAALHTVHNVAALQQKFGEVCAVLAGDACDERRSLHDSSQVTNCHTSMGLLQLWILMYACDTPARTHYEHEQGERHQHRRHDPLIKILAAETLQPAQPKTRC